MGGFHYIDLIVILGIILALLGSKSLQSMARGVGKGMGQAKAAKDKVLAELPMEEISKVSEKFSKIPLSPNQAVQMLLTPTPEKGREEQKQEEPKAES